MSHLTVSSPVGELTIFEDAGAIVALEWGRAPIDPRKPSALLKRAARQLDEYFAGSRKTFDLPLKPAGTAFQQRVWARLSAIPRGRVETYGALAKKLRSGARAVGTACGANPIPILIPCHRVLGARGRIPARFKGCAPIWARGSLGGYSGEGGVATKQFLLAHEGAPGASCECMPTGMKAPKT
jgi:methylated-DNA-[protein]-cysteine S-methyltransferase